MGIEVVRARSRAGENGPPLSLFNAEKSYQYWMDNNHRLAMKIKKSESLVLMRLRKEAKKYNAKQTRNAQERGTENAICRTGLEVDATRHATDREHYFCDRGFARACLSAFSP